MEDTKHEKTKEEEQNDADDDVKEEKEGIEMTDDFDCKISPSRSSNKLFLES